jgi:hypothetical protein
MSCHGFFPEEYKEFGSLLITDCISVINTPKDLETRQQANKDHSYLSVTAFWHGF